MSSTQGYPPCRHTIEDGDTFSQLAWAYYGDGSDRLANQIAQANPGVDPSSLRIGDIINIPSR
jgi:nucleoid-associated protein YgaU